MAPWGPWGRGGLLPSWGPCLQSSQRTWQDRAWTSTILHRRKAESVNTPSPHHGLSASVRSSAKCKLPLERAVGGPGPLDLHSHESFL